MTCQLIRPPRRCSPPLGWTYPGPLPGHCGSPSLSPTLIAGLGLTLTVPALEWLIARAPDDLARSSGQALPVQIVNHLDPSPGEERRTGSFDHAARAAMVASSLAALLAPAVGAGVFSC